MYLARVVRSWKGIRAFVHPVTDTELIMTSCREPRDMKHGPRRKRAWRTKDGAAAISDTAHSAIGAAKVMLESVR
jgi:hypothetical protein